MLSASTALSHAAASLWPSLARRRLVRLVLLALLALLAPSLAFAQAARPSAPSPFPHPRAASGPGWRLTAPTARPGPAASTDLGESTAPQAPDAHSDLILRTPPARRGAGAWGPSPHTDHLGSTNYSTNNDQFLIQHDEYYPSGELWTDQTDSRYELARRFVFAGKEQDIHTGLIDFGARSYDARQGQWLSADPMTLEPSLWSSQERLEEPYSWSPYAYVANNPLGFIDPDGRDAIPIAFTSYKVGASGMRIPGLGHAGIILIDSRTGRTKYYEYGRYDRAGKGLVVRRRIPDVKIDPKTGQPTAESLKKVLQEVSRKAGKGSQVDGTYVKNDNFDEMASYAQELEAKNGDPNREDYNICTRNCATFVQDVLEAGGEDTPTMIDPRPNSYIEELKDHYGNSISYDPKTKKVSQTQAE